jgi:hypothetical protein
MTREEAVEVLKNTEDNINYDKRRDEIYFTHRWVGAYEMAISALREQPRWINVKERLPEESGRYLALQGYTLARLLSWTHCYDGFEEHLKGREVWYDYDSEWGECEVRNITHWMPLPPPPEVEG